MGSNRSLDTDKLLAALLNFHNTPDRDTGLSPAQVIFGRKIKDYLPIKPGQFIPFPPSNHRYRLRSLGEAVKIVV